jgi:pre-mRNA-splicing factor SYF1
LPDAVTGSQDEFELRMARYEDLLDRQQLLISNVILRQNPHNVKEWHKRISLFEDTPKLMVAEFTNALRTIDPQKAGGKLHTVWVRFAKFWEENDQLESARKVFEKGVAEKFKNPDHLACPYI